MTSTQAPATGLGAGETREIVGDIDDTRLAQIEALAPTRAELEAAVAWVAGADDEMHKERRELAGKVAAIFDLLAVDLPPEEDR